MAHPRLGAHMSIEGGPAQAFSRGRLVGCDAMQIFTRNANRWASRPMTDAEVTDFHRAAEETGIAPVVVHSSYLINLGSPDDTLWEKSIAAAVDEIERCRLLGISSYVLHPGAHMGAGEEAGIARVAAALNRVIEATPASEIIITLENTAGSGSSLGYSFENLGAIISSNRYPERLGMCFDTAHALAAGYDYRTPESYRAMWQNLDETVGIKRLRAIHMNDSKKDLGSRVDRHDQIGQGFVTLEAFRMLVNDAQLVHLPMLLETPKGPEMQEDIANLALLRSLFA
ncbi:MAG: deoxyribonuclease IV [Chloroflexi bacterium]|nr:deoxyribonuclease IV [Chloroflexota bacterium]